jgi:hypothetical protein
LERLGVASLPLTSLSKKKKRPYMPHALPGDPGYTSTLQY